MALGRVRSAFETASAVRKLRLHGDVKAGNIVELEVFSGLHGFNFSVRGQLHWRQTSGSAWYTLLMCLAQLGAQRGLVVGSAGGPTPLSPAGRPGRGSRRRHRSGCDVCRCRESGRPCAPAIASKFRPSDGFMRERYSTAFWPSRYTSFLSDKGALTR